MKVVSLDLTAIQQSGKMTKVNTKKGPRVFINICVSDRKGGADKYGNDVTVFISQTKQERDLNTPVVYCGQGKNYGATTAGFEDFSLGDAHEKEDDVKEQHIDNVDDLPI